MENSGKGLLYFYQQASSLIGNQTNHRKKVCLPYQPNSCYESDCECICIVINGKKHSVPLNILSSVYINLFFLTKYFMVRKQKRNILEQEHQFCVNTYNYFTLKLVDAIRQFTP